MRKSTFIFLFTLLINYSNAQTVGIVYNINPTMGYSFCKGLFKFEVLNQHDLNYNVVNYIESYMNNKKIPNKIFDDFDFSAIEYFTERIKLKKMAEYVENYCEKNNLDRIIILRKNNAYTSTDFMRTLHNFEHDLGIITFNLEKKKTLLYYNYVIINYTKGSRKFKAVLRSNYKSQKFEEPIFDSVKLNLVNNNVFNYHVTGYNSIISRFLDESIPFVLE